MADASESANTSATSTPLSAALIAAHELVKPKSCYVINGGMRQLEFEGGMVIDLEKRDRAVVIMVLTPEQAAQIREGPTDIVELIDQMQTA